MGVVRKVGILLLLAFVNACASSVKVERSEEYLCGQQLVTVDYLSDNSMIIEIKGERIYLNSCSSGCRSRYQDITKNTRFWHKGNKAYLKIGRISYSVCENLFR